jgi:hypothetical protein
MILPTTTVNMVFSGLKIGRLRIEFTIPYMLLDNYRAKILLCTKRRTNGNSKTLFGGKEKPATCSLWGGDDLTRNGREAAEMLLPLQFCSVHLPSKVYAITWRKRERPISLPLLPPKRSCSYSYVIDGLSTYRISLSASCGESFRYQFLASLRPQ